MPVPRTAARISALLASLADVRRALDARGAVNESLVSRLRALERALTAELALVRAQPHSARDLLAANLRRERRRQALSQEGLAHRAGLDRSYVSSIERCERNVGIDNVDRLASALDVSVGYLMQPAPQAEQLRVAGDRRG